MIDVKLSIESYNRLFLYCLQSELEGENKIYVKIKHNKIVFVEDYESDVVIASVDLDTTEGKILSYYTECLLRIECNSDGILFVHESCMNPNDEYIGHCYNCFVNYCKSSYSCRKGIYEKIKKMDVSINDLRFIDPIPNRRYEFLEEIERYVDIIKGLGNEFSHISDDEAKKICETAHLLQCQLKALHDKWGYGTFNKWCYDSIEENLNNGNR